ncbi:MAG: hypothetical protein MUC60_12020 [Oscillatoria sp. Prado101]|nr:hypothetical protein [Oscillatoria sp. Prado101]
MPATLGVGENRNFSKRRQRQWWPETRFLKETGFLRMRRHGKATPALE